jgi:ABC-2 type transport system ATP-binding protein
MIRVENLLKRYGPVRAVDGVSFEVQRGEVVGFLGPNGAGKSTTMKILTGYLVPDGGVAEIAGHSTDGRGTRARRHVGYLPESTPLYRAERVDRYLDFVGRVRGLGRRARRAAIQRVVEECDLRGMTRRRIGALSKGYRQRVGLAQALLSNPDVLILDEPTSGLDPAEVVRIRELIRRLGEDRTVLLSTHVLHEVQESCQRVVILTGGRVVADGSPIDLAEAEEAGLRVTLRAREGEALEALRGIDGAREVEVAGRDGAGRTRFLLFGEDRHALAEEVARLAVQRGFGLVEMTHEVPSLETVFLRRTARAEAAAAPAGPFAGAAPVDPPAAEAIPEVDP